MLVLPNRRLRERELIERAENRERELSELAERARELSELAERRERELAELTESRERELAEREQSRERDLAELTERERELAALAENRGREVSELAEARERVCAALWELEADHASETIAVFTHGGAIGVFCQSVLGLSHETRAPFMVDNTALFEIEVRNGKGTLWTANDTCHLSAE